MWNMQLCIVCKFVKNVVHGFYFKYNILMIVHILFLGSLITPSGDTIPCFAA